MRILALGLGLTALPAQALAQDAEATPCIQLLQLTWSDLVRTPVPRTSFNTPPSISLSPVGTQARNSRSPLDQPVPDDLEDPASDLLATLADACRDEREPLLDISLLHASRQAEMGRFGEALALLDRVTPQPGDKVFAAYYAQRLKLHWAQLMRRDRLRPYEDPQPSEALAAYEDARDRVLELNHQQLLAQGLFPEEVVRVAGATVRGYRLPEQTPGEVQLVDGQVPGWILIAAMPNGALMRINAFPSQWAPAGELPPLGMRNVECSSSGGGIETGDLRFDGSLGYAQVAAALEAHFTRDPDELVHGLPSRPGMPNFCPNFAEILPGLGPEYEFIGTEYRDHDEPFSELDIVTALQSEDAGTRDWASEYVLDHPDLVEPINLIFAVGNLVQRGDMERASFWYYIWQIRTRPWMTPEGGQAQVRGALNATFGPVINEWAGSDFDALRQLYIRAIRYELEFPLYERRPDGMGRRDWRRAVAAAREQNSEEAILEMLDGMGREGFAARRRENGLYVGPWQSPGRPLKDEWLVDGDE